MLRCFPNVKSPVLPDSAKRKRKGFGDFMLELGLHEEEGRARDGGAFDAAILVSASEQRNYDRVATKLVACT